MTFFAAGADVFAFAFAGFACVLVAYAAGFLAPFAYYFEAAGLFFDGVEVAVVFLLAGFFVGAAGVFFAGVA